MDSSVSLVFKAVDQLSGPVKNIDSNLKKLEGSVGRISSRLGAAGSVLRGFFEQIGRRAFDGLIQGIERVVSLIPKLIDGGKQWLDTVDKVADATGLAGQQASVLAAQAQGLEVPVDALGIAFARFTQNIRPQEQLLAGLGVATRNTNGTMRDAAAIFYDVNRAVSNSSSGIDRAAVMSKLFGRNWREVADLLTASPQTLDAWGQHAAAAGLVVSDAALQARQDFVRTQIALRQSVTGLGTQIFTAVAPALTGLVNAVRSAIDANMGQIANFVSRVVGFVVGAISGLFGLNLQLANFAAGAPVATTGTRDLGDQLDKLGKPGGSADAASHRIDALQDRMKGLDAQLRVIDRREQAYNAARERKSILQQIADARRGSDATDGFTASIDRQIDAIDRRLAALDKQNRANDAEKQREEIVSQIGDLQAQLEDLKGHAVFTAGMSALEAELARQQQAQAITDKQKEISDAKQRLADHDQQVQDQRTRDDLQAERDALEKKKSLHAQQVSDQKSLNDALDRLRDFDHQQQVDRQRQALEDQKRNLQDQISAIQKATKPAGDAGLKLGKSIGTGITESDPFKGLAPGFTSAMQDALRQGSGFADRIHDMLFGGVPQVNAYTGFTTGKSEGLIEKIQKLIDGFSTFWNTTLKPIWDAMNQLTQPLKDLLGPQGFATLFVLWKTGVIPFAVSLITSMSGVVVAIGKLLLSPLFGGRGTGSPSSPTAPGTGAEPAKGNEGGRGVNEEPSRPGVKGLEDLGEEGTGPGRGAMTVGALAAIVAAVSAATVYHTGSRTATQNLQELTTSDWNRLMPQQYWAMVKFAQSQGIAYPPPTPGQAAYMGDVGNSSTGSPPVSPDQYDRSGYNNPTYEHDSLKTIADALSPGGQFFQQHYDQTAATTAAANDTARGADAAETTRDNTGQGTTATQGVLAKILSGITSTITGNVPVVNASTGFNVAVPGVTQTSTTVQGNVPVVNASTGFTTNVAGNVPVINASTGFNVGLPGKPPVDVGTPTVNAATGFTVGISNTVPVKAAVPLVLDDGTVLPVKGAGLNIPVNVQNTPQVASAPGFAIGKINDVLSLDGASSVAVRGQVPIFTNQGTVDIASTGPIDAIRGNSRAAATNTDPLTRWRMVNGKLAVYTGSSGGTASGGCFVAGTPIDTPRGPVAIEKIKVGDVVLAMNEKDMQIVERRVLTLLPHPEHTERRLLVTTSDGARLHVTASHRFYHVSCRGWHSIGEMHVGDALWTAQGIVSIVSIKKLGEDPVDVYNFEVEIDHNYFAGGILVHNIKPTNATGAVGLTRGATVLGWAGEAGDEAVAIIRNPRPISGGSSGGFGGASGRSSGVRQPLEINLVVDGQKLARATVDDLVSLLIREHGFSSTNR